MWKKESYYFEQPNVRFRNELFIEVFTEDSVKGAESFMFSTVRSINQLSMNEIGVPLIKQSVIDKNEDGLMDRLELRIEIKSLPGRGLPITSSVRAVNIIGSVDYSLSSMLQLEMISLFQVQMATPNGASTIKSKGELKLIQTSPTNIDNQRRSVYNVNPFDDYAKYPFSEILESHEFRKGKTPTCFKIYLERT